MVDRHSQAVPRTAVTAGARDEGCSAPERASIMTLYRSATAAPAYPAQQGPRVHGPCSQPFNQPPLLFATRSMTQAFGTTISRGSVTVRPTDTKVLAAPSCNSFNSSLVVRSPPRPEGGKAWQHHANVRPLPGAAFGACSI